MKFKFQMENKDVNKRKEMSEKLRKQFPDKIPIICEKDPKSKIQEIDKTKYLVPMDLTVAQFSLMIRKRVEIAKEDAFYLLVDGKHSIIGDSLISEIYDKYKSEDGFLYIAYASEVTWGY